VGRTLTIEVPEVFLPLLQPSRYKGVYGGRGSAKSHFLSELLVERSVYKKTRAVCVREYQKSLAQSVKQLLEDKIKKFGLTKDFRVLNTHIETPHDGIIIFQGMSTQTEDSIKSLEGYHIAWVEEAQSLSENSLKLLRPTLREADSELWFSWNPRSPKDPVDKLLRSADTPPGSIVIQSNYRDNPWFPDVLKKEMLWDRARDPDKYAHIWLGQYERNSESRVFKNWRVEEFEAPADAVFRYGADWGFSVDPSVLVRCFADGRKLFIDFEAYKIGCEIDHLPALFDTVPGARLWPITADSARPETISYLRRNGFPRLGPAVKGKDSVKEGVTFLQNYDIIVHPRCVKTIDELTMYSFKIDRQTDEVLPVLEDKKNHVIDSLRYAVEKLRTNQQKAKTVQLAGWG
jgi:phage terminase large subunit